VTAPSYWTNEYCFLHYQEDTN